MSIILLNSFFQGLLVRLPYIQSATSYINKNVCSIAIIDSIKNVIFVPLLFLVQKRFPEVVDADNREIGLRSGHRSLPCHVSTASPTFPISETTA